MEALSPSSSIEFIAWSNSAVLKPSSFGVGWDGSVSLYEAVLLTISSEVGVVVACSPVGVGLVGVGAGCPATSSIVGTVGVVGTGMAGGSARLGVVPTGMAGEPAVPARRDLCTRGVRAAGRDRKAAGESVAGAPGGVTRDIRQKTEDRRRKTQG